MFQMIHKTIFFSKKTRQSLLIFQKRSKQCYKAQNFVHEGAWIAWMLFASDLETFIFDCDADVNLSKAKVGVDFYLVSGIRNGEKIGK